MDPIVEALNTDEIADLEAKRTWVLDHYADDAKHRYESVNGKLQLLDVILRNGWIAPDERIKLLCLGVAFGDALAQELGLKWVAVEDDYGRDPALTVEGTSIRVFPLTSIAKRIEAGEEVNVFDLFESACANIEQLIRDGA